MESETLNRSERAYTTMLMIRLFEEELDRQFSAGSLRGTCHLCVGQEAVAAGVGLNLTSDDRVTSTHRGHGHLLACGGDPERLFAEVMGKETGYCRGRGGSQHLTAPDVGFVAANGITGGGVPIGTGIGLAIKQQKRPGLSVVFLGDGATGQGVFYESLNLAAIWKLPVLYVCENNGYAMSTPQNVTYPFSLTRKAEAFGIATATVDGMDVEAVDRAVQSAMITVREKGEPFFLECRTYRYMGHSRSDRRLYRTDEEEAEWLARDPIPRQAKGIAEKGGDPETLELTVRARMAMALEAARKAPLV